MSYKSLMRRSTRRHQVEFLSDSDSDMEDRNHSTASPRRTPLSAPPLYTEPASPPSKAKPEQITMSNPPPQANAAVTAAPVAMTALLPKADHCIPQDMAFQGFDSPQQPQLSAPKSPQWVRPDIKLSPCKSPGYASPDNKENALPEPTSASKRSPGSHMPVDARTLQRVESLEQSFLQHRQQVQTQMDSMQEQLTALSQKQLDTASFPEEVVHHIEQDLAEVISRLDRQVDALAGRVDKLPSPEDWNIMEQALAAILDEAAARAQEEDRLAEEAAERGGGPLRFIEEEEEAVQASSGESRVKQEGSQETQEHDEQDDGGDPLAVAIKQEPEDDSLGSLVDQAQLEESLQQQQAVTQQMLDVMNEKIENWVCQCFSDLRNRIIELERSSTIAKAETLQASIGVSCNEEDLQDCHADVSAASGFEGSTLNTPTLLGSPQGESASAARQKNPTLAEQTDDSLEAALEVDRAAAVESPLQQGPLDQPYRYKELQLSPIQIAGAGVSLVAAVAFYIAIELWRYKSDMMHFPH
ncbi:hypothetical protein ABBQ38_005998 [Trebouxia sp. C0009 RCD-2024]